MMERQDMGKIIDDNDCDSCFDHARKEGIIFGYHPALDGIGLAGVYQTFNGNSFFIFNELLEQEDQEEVCFMLLSKHITHQHVDCVIPIEEFINMKLSRSIFSESKKLKMFAFISSITSRLASLFHI